MQFDQEPELGGGSARYLQLSQQIIGMVGGCRSAKTATLEPGARNSIPPRWGGSAPVEESGT